MRNLYCMHSDSKSKNYGLLFNTLPHYLHISVTICFQKLLNTQQLTTIHLHRQGSSAFKPNIIHDTNTKLKHPYNEHPKCQKLAINPKSPKQPLLKTKKKKFQATLS